jgi:flagellar hook assembly protein FlgD
MLRNNASVKIELFNSSGVLIRTIFNGQLSEGKYTFTVSFENMQSGIYNYTITANNKYVIAKKMIAIK